MFKSGKSVHPFISSLRAGASLAVLALMTVPAMAQSGSSVENVTVTGSRIITNGVDAPTPVTVVPVTELTATTPSDIPDALNKLPIFEGSRSQTTTGGATINWPGNFLNLRDFGSVRTLILFNGNRVAPVDGSGDVDTNILPQALMSRVDVVTGGASAVYGSDAVTGVVNFVIDQHFNGLKMSADAGISGLADDASWHASIVGGKDVFGGRGHFEFSYEHHSSDGIDNMMTRPLGPKVYTEPGAVVGGGTGGTTANPFTLQANSRLPTYAVGGYIASGPLANTTFTSNGVLGPFVHGQLSGTSNDEMGGSGGYGGQAYFLFPGVPANPWLVASLRSDQGFARFDYDLTDSVHFYLQGNATQSSNFSIAFPSNFSAVYNSDNPYLPANARALLGCGATLPTVCTTPSFTMARQVANQPASPSVGYTRGLNLTTGLSGSIMNNRFDWSFNYSHSENTQSEKSPYNINFQKLYAADDGVINPATGQASCYVSLTAAGAAAYPGCIPINAFGPSATTAEQWAYVTDQTYWKTKNGMDDLNASITGTLFDGWAGPVKGALSAEYRNMSLETDSAYNPVAKVNCAFQNPLTCNSGQALYNSVNAAIPQVNEGIAEGAAEVDVPLLKDIPLVELLTFNGAYRFANYSVSGDAQTWKAGLVWNVTDEVSFRGAVSRDLRAPTLANLFAPPSGNVTAFTDYLTGASNNLLQVSQGNAALKPEVSRTDTLGFVYKPGWIPNFSLMADWYDIRITNAISSVSGGSITSEQICQQSGGVSFYCSLIVRPGAYNDTRPSNFPTEVLSEVENIARNTTHGIDAEADYNFEMSAIDDSLPGTINMRLLGSYQPSFLSFSGIPGAVITNAAGAVGVPAGRVTWDIGYLTGPLSINVQERWHSSERQNSNPTLVYVTPSIRQIFYTDLSAAYEFKMDSTDTDKNWQAFLSINNLFNQLPHLYSSTGVDAAQGYAYPYPSDEDVIGRYFTIGIRYKM